MERPYVRATRNVLFRPRKLSCALRPKPFPALERLFVLLECPLGKVPPVSPKLGLISDDEPFGAPAGPRTAVARFAQAPHGHPKALG